MNYFLLAETDFFRLINEAGDCNMETAYTAFATQVIELCNGGMDMNLTVIALAYIEIELQYHPVRNLPEERREIAAYVSKALSFVRKMQKFLATPQVPPLISANNSTETTTSLLQWTGNSIDLVELIYGIDEMGCINNGNMPLKQLAPLLYKIFGVDSKDCYRFYTDIKRRKNESRTYFIDRMHSEALGQILNATCKEEYESIKAACQTDFIFNDKDSTDLSIYMPVLNVSKAITLNPEGFVCIAGERKNMKEFENYDGYKKELSLLYPVPLGVTIENGINRVHVKTKKRKFTAQIGMRGNQQAIRVNASKKILWGWVEYTTAYYWKYTPNGPVQFGKEVKSGHDIMILGNPFPNGAKLYMWTRGTGEENCGIMTVQL